MSAFLKKAVGIVFKTLAGLLIFVFFVIYVVIPIGGPWAIRSQGSKLLGHKVAVRSVWLNPFMCRVSVDGLKVYDADKKTVMAGFNRFWVDVSFLGLFKKMYRIESVGLDGLEVNAALLPGNKINLMELVPAQTAPAPTVVKTQDRTPALVQTKEVKTTVPSSVKASQPLPLIVIDKIILKRGTVTFTDRTLDPRFLTRLSDMTLTVTNFSTDPARVANAVFSTKLDEKGLISAETNFKPLAQPLEMESTFTLDDYALTVLTPYVGKYTGRSVGSGKMELRMDYRIANNQLNARHKLLIQKFDFGRKVESKDALPLPFGLAVALLEDPQGRISISLPVKGDMSKPEFEYFHLIGQVVTNFFTKLITSPFTALLSALGEESGTEELGTATFEPGQALLTEKTQQALALFVKVLENRPKLSVEVNGSYDPEADWKAMKAQAYEDEFAKLRADSMRPDFELIEYIYKVHFGMTAYWDLARKYTTGKTVDEPALQAQMKRLIIERGRPDRGAMENLAHARAKAVYDYIVTAGFDTARIRIGASKETRASLGSVPLEWTMTVYEKEPHA